MTAKYFYKQYKIGWFKLVVYRLRHKFSYQLTIENDWN
jgi:hypothetical protein